MINFIPRPLALTKLKTLQSHKPGKTSLRSQNTQESKTIPKGILMHPKKPFRNFRKPQKPATAQEVLKIFKGTLETLKNLKRP